MLKSSNPLLFVLVLTASLTISCSGEPTLPTPTIVPPTPTPSYLLTAKQAASIVNPYILATNWAKTTTSHAHSKPETFHHRFLILPDTSCSKELPLARQPQDLTPCQTPLQTAPFDHWTRKTPVDRTARVNLALSNLWTHMDPSAQIPPSTAASLHRLVSKENHSQYAAIAASFAHCNNPEPHISALVQAPDPHRMASAWLKATDAFAPCIQAALPQR